MKYIRAYEKVKQNELKSGDYVLIKIDTQLHNIQFNNKKMVMKLTCDPRSFGRGFIILLENGIDGTVYDQEIFYGDEIIKKLTSKEAELYINAKKL